MSDEGKKKIKIDRYNPSSRKNEIIEIEQVQIGTVKYKDIGDNFECLVGIETEDSDAGLYRGKSVTMNSPRRISRIRWDVSKHHSLGDRVDLSPRDIQVLDAILQYLKKMGYHVG